MVACKYGARELLDPRPFAVGKMRETYESYPEIGPLFPAMGYSQEQIMDMQERSLPATWCTNSEGRYELKEIVEDVLRKSLGELGLLRCGRGGRLGLMPICVSLLRSQR